MLTRRCSHLPLCTGCTSDMQFVPLVCTLWMCTDAEIATDFEISSLSAYVKVKLCFYKPLYFMKVSIEVNIILCEVDSLLAISKKRTNSNVTNILFHSSQLSLYPGHISTVRCRKVAVMSRSSLYARLAVPWVVSGVVIVKWSVTSGGSSQDIIVEVGIVIVYGRGTTGGGIADIGGSF